MALRYEGAVAADAARADIANAAAASPPVQPYIGGVTDTVVLPENVKPKPEGKLDEPGRGGYVLFESLDITKGEYNRFMVHFYLYRPGLPLMVFIS